MADPLRDLESMGRHAELLPERFHEPVLAQSRLSRQVRERDVRCGAIGDQRQGAPQGGDPGPARSPVLCRAVRRPPCCLLPPAGQGSLPLQPGCGPGKQPVQGHEAARQPGIRRHRVREERHHLPPEAGIAGKGGHIRQFHDQQAAPPRPVRRRHPPVGHGRIKHGEAAGPDDMTPPAAHDAHGAPLNHADHVLPARLGRVRGNDPVHRDDPRQPVRPPRPHRRSCIRPACSCPVHVPCLHQTAGPAPTMWTHTR
jgi:hypothetical protein